MHWFRSIGDRTLRRGSSKSSRQGPCTTISVVPPEILCQVFRQLDSALDCWSCAGVNLEWRQLILLNDSHICAPLAGKLEQTVYTITATECCDVDPGLGPWLNACLRFELTMRNMHRDDHLSIRASDRIRIPSVNRFEKNFQTHVSVSVHEDMQLLGCGNNHILAVQPLQEPSNGKPVQQNLIEIDPITRMFHIHENGMEKLEKSRWSSRGMKVLTRQLPGAEEEIRFEYEAFPFLKLRPSNDYILLTTEPPFRRSDGLSQLKMTIVGMELSSRCKFRASFTQIPLHCRILVGKKVLVAIDMSERQVHLVELPSTRYIGVQSLDIDTHPSDFTALSDTHFLYYSTTDMSLRACPLLEMMQKIEWNVVLTLRFAVSWYLEPLNIQCTPYTILLTFALDNAAYLVLVHILNWNVEVFAHDYTQGCEAPETDWVRRAFTKSPRKFEDTNPAAYWCVSDDGQVTHITQPALEAMAQSCRSRPNDQWWMDAWPYIV